jgi:tRNA threonylcarbamoyl adenosine modification protein (Sua5/YciO/YrdC/YwlC family)
MKNGYPNIADAAAMERALRTLKTGGVVVLPTDTLFGLSARISSRTAVGRIAAAKGTPDRSRFKVLAASIDIVDGYVSSYGCVAGARMDRSGAAPLTAILPSGAKCPAWTGESVAFRVPGVEPLRDLIGALGEPVVSTSVNAAGQPPLTDPGEIAERFGASVDLILTGAGQTGRASTIVDCTGARPEVVRAGDYDWENHG